MCLCLGRTVHTAWTPAKEEQIEWDLRGQSRAKSFDRSKQCSQYRELMDCQGCRSSRSSDSHCWFHNDVGFLRSQTQGTPCRCHRVPPLDLHWTERLHTDCFGLEHANCLESLVHRLRLYSQLQPQGRQPNLIWDSRRMRAFHRPWIARRRA